MYFDNPTDYETLVRADLARFSRHYLVTYDGGNLVHHCSGERAEEEDRREIVGECMARGTAVRRVERLTREGVLLWAGIL